MLGELKEKQFSCALGSHSLSHLSNRHYLACQVWPRPLIKCGVQTAGGLLVLRDPMDEELKEKSIKKLFKIICHC